MDRRRFVRFTVGAAAAGALAGAAGGLARPLVEPRPPRGSPVRYVGAVRTGGPAPRGVPLIPLRLTEDGTLAGRASVDRPTEPERPFSVLPWYRYCDHQGAPGLDEGAVADDTLRYFVVDDATGPLKPWFAHRDGDAVRPEHFPDDDFGAAFRWRSEGAAGRDVLTGVVLRLPRGSVRRTRGSPAPPAMPITDAEWRLVQERFLVTVGSSEFVAASTFCTHFCCTAGYRATDAATRYDAWDRLYCACHHSVYDVRSPAAYEFRPEA